MRPEEAPAVSELVYRAFRDSVAPRYSEEGQREFFTYAAPDRLAERQRHGQRILVATLDGRIVGMVEVRPPSHIAQLFIDQPFRGQGIARALLGAAFPEAELRRLTVTVNAAPDAVSAYGRLGFRVVAPEQVRNGVRFVPMTRTYGAVFFPVSVPKFVAMCLGSLGLYQMAWIYWNWQYERDRTSEPLSPFWRTCFAPLWIHSLVHRMSRTARGADVPVGWHPGFVTVAVILLWFAILLPDPWWLLSLLAFLPTIPVQRTVNSLNHQVAPAAPKNDRYSLGNVVLLVAGISILALTLWALFGGSPGLRRRESVSV